MKKTILFATVTLLSIVGCNKPESPITEGNRALTVGACFVTTAPDTLSKRACESASKSLANVSTSAASSDWVAGYTAWKASADAGLKMAHPSLSLVNVDPIAGTAVLRGYLKDGSRQDSLLAQGTQIVNNSGASFDLTLNPDFQIDPNASFVNPISTDQAAQLSTNAKSKFSTEGLGWLDLDVTQASQGILALSGSVPTAEAKAAAFRDARATLSGLPNGANLLVVDNIASEDAIFPTLGQNVLSLFEQDKTRKNCQAALDGSLDGRNIGFQTGKANISFESARLLDAAAAIFILCKDLNIEIQGHTDARGNPNSNKRLSEARANAVRAYLLDRGSEAGKVTAVGYGDTKPLDPAQTPEAWAKNRRTGFVVQ